MVTRKSTNQGKRSFDLEAKLDISVVQKESYGNSIRCFILVTKKILKTTRTLYKSVLKFFGYII